jgi:two-component system sensor histidine kinase KdpD
MERDESVQHFLDLIKRSRRGKLKIYIGMSAGVGKTYRMLEEAHTLRRNGVDVRIGYVEPHGRPETLELVEGLPVIPRKSVFYKGKALEELDLEAVLQGRPEIVIVDELAHSNIPGSKNEKRWQDVLDILNAGINVISAVNIQHIESLNEDVKAITGIDVQERVPDNILREADEVVNIDLTSDELITRLKEGKIYTQDKVETALKNFFKRDSILQLRELALKEVAGQVERKVEAEVPKQQAFRHEKFLACISSNPDSARTVIRKTARLASYYNAQWFTLFVETPKENIEKIALDKQRHLINNFKLATELGSEIIRVNAPDVGRTVVEIMDQRQITTVCIGKPRISLLKLISAKSVFRYLLSRLSDKGDVDLIILA